jgi:hypothetical protein
VFIPLALQRAFLALYQDMSEVNIRISKRNLFGNDANDSGDDTTDAFTTEQDEDALDEAQRRLQELDDLQRELVSLLFGPIFMFAISMATAMLANHPAAEKTAGLIGSLRVVGMADSAYWMSWWMTLTVVVIVPSCLLTTAVIYALDVALLTDVNALALTLAFLTQYSSLLALQFLAVAVATSRPFLYALYFCILCLSVTSVSLAAFFRAGPEDTAGRVFQYLMPGYNLGGILDSMYRYNTRFGDYLPASNVTQYELDNLFSAFGMCNETSLNIDPTVCQDIDLVDDTTKCWKYINCRDETYIWDENQCAPDTCYFTPLSDIARLVVMLVHSVVFMALAWYALQVIPSGNGLTYRPWFFLTPQYWKSASNASRPTETDNERQRQSRQTESIVLQGLTKEFKTQKAVNNVDMEIQKGQVRTGFGGGDVSGACPKSHRAPTIAGVCAPGPQRCRQDYFDQHVDRKDVTNLWRGVRLGIVIERQCPQRPTFDELCAPTRFVVGRIECDRTHSHVCTNQRCSSTRIGRRN